MNKMNIQEKILSLEKELEQLKEEYKAQQRAPKYKADQFISFQGNLFFIYKVEKAYDGRDEYFYSIQIARSNSCYEQNEQRSFLSPYQNGSGSKSSIYNDAVIVSDSEALQLLKEYYAKQGIVEGARVSNKIGSYTIHHFDLAKNNAGLRNSGKIYCDYGNSQLAIFIGLGKFYITPTAEDFKIIPKELEVAGFIAEKLSPINAPECIKIGCQWYTKDSLITIRDLIKAISDITNKCRFNHSAAGFIEVTVDELNQAIELFDK